MKYDKSAANLRVADPCTVFPHAEPRAVTSQVRQGRCPEASRKPCPVKILAAGRQLGRAANWGQRAATHNDALHGHSAARGTGDLDRWPSIRIVCTAGTDWNVRACRRVRNGHGVQK